MTDKDKHTPRPAEFASAADLAMHPLAGAAALSALGMGVASQAFGLWMGAVAGSLEATQRLFTHPLPGGTAADDASLPAFKGSTSPEVRAKAAVDTMIADAASVARQAGEVADKTARAVIADASRATEAVVKPKRRPTPETPNAKAAEFARPQAQTKPAAPDDLKAISGIGPKLEKVLNDLGVWTYAQIASWTPAEIGWVDDHLGFGGRIGRDDWLGQAAELAKTRD